MKKFITIIALITITVSAVFAQIKFNSDGYKRGFPYDMYGIYSRAIEMDKDTESVVLAWDSGASAIEDRLLQPFMKMLQKQNPDISYLLLGPEELIQLRGDEDAKSKIIANVIIDMKLQYPYVYVYKMIWTFKDQTGLEITIVRAKDSGRFILGFREY